MYKNTNRSRVELNFSSKTVECLGPSDRARFIATQNCHAQKLVFVSRWSWWHTDRGCMHMHNPIGLRLCLLCAYQL